MPSFPVSMADFSTPLPQAGGAAAAADGTGVASGLVTKAKEAFSRLKVLSISFFNPLEFSRPASQAEWIARVSANAKHFALVYACFFAPVLIHTMMSSMWLRIGSLLICGMWGYAYGPKAADDQIFGVPFSKLTTCATATVLVMLISGMVNALFYATVLFSLIGMPHMSLHIAPTPGDVEMQPLAPSF